MCGSKFAVGCKEGKGGGSFHPVRKGGSVGDVGRLWLCIPIADPAGASGTAVWDNGMEKALVVRHEEG